MSEGTLKKSKSKYLFVLKNIDVMKIMSKYGIHVSSNIPSISHIHPINTTDLTSLRESTFLKHKEPEKITFLDEAKRLRSCTLSKIDFEKGKRWCWWCKYPFDTPPWGCPIKLKSAIKRLCLHHRWNVLQRKLLFGLDRRQQEKNRILAVRILAFKNVQADQ
jgi:hypothetical protein